MRLNVQLKIESRKDEVAKTRRWLAEHAQKAGFDPSVINDLKLVVTEAVTNIIRHAYQGESENLIFLSLTTDDEKLEMTLRDFGRSFDPDIYQTPNLNEPGEGGYGLFLINSLMDKVRYKTEKQGNTWVFVKYRDPTASKA